jgi:glycosyltransferase involved in cell wall biosynthesis
MKSGVTMTTINAVLVGPSSRYTGGIVDYTSMLNRSLKKIANVVPIPIEKIVPDFAYPGKIGTCKNDVERIPMNPGLNLLLPHSWIRTGLWLKRCDASIIHIQYWTLLQAPAYLFIFAFLKLLKNKGKIILHFHNVRPHEASHVALFLSRRVNSLLTGYSDGIVVHTQADLANIQKDIGFKKKQISVIPLPLYEIYSKKEQLSKEEAQHYLGLNNRNVLLFFGIIREYKGLDDLLEAMYLVKKTIPDVLLIVAGKFWASEQSTIRKIERLNLGENVRFYSRWIKDEEVSIFFSASDVAVFPYKTSSHSAALMTALSFPIRIIGTKVGGLAETLQNCSRAKLVPPNEPVSLSKAIVELLMTRESQFHLKQQEDWLRIDAIAQRIVSFWDQILVET